MRISNAGGDLFAEIGNVNVSKIIFPGIPPSSWLQGRIFVCQLSDIGISLRRISEYTEQIHNSEFIYDHVGGMVKNSPKRGVYVFGNEAGNIKIDKTYWTASQNSSNITLVSETTSYPSEVKRIIPNLAKYMSDCFPDAPVSGSTFSLTVVNRYDACEENGRYEGENTCNCQHKIAPHTDAQPWYASPPVFASITTFPEGQPSDYRATYRFQVLDEGYIKPKWVDVFLQHESVCMMRADITHRVLPPLKSFRPHRSRVNATFRNLSCERSDPLGFVLAMGNHYRYYGIPKKLIIPSGCSASQDILDKYERINPNLEIEETLHSQDRKEKKADLRRKIARLYEGGGYVLDKTMMSKTNVTLEALECTMDLLRITDEQIGK